MNSHSGSDDGIHPQNSSDTRSIVTATPVPLAFCWCNSGHESRRRVLGLAERTNRIGSRPPDGSGTAVNLKWSKAT